MKINERYAPFITTVLMAIIMVFIMTGIVTAMNLNGFPHNFLDKWLRAYGSVVFIVMFLMLTLRPLIQKFVFIFVKDKDKDKIFR
ncbi:MAG TPA: DUF2798 domain-containing protein [Epsilonproteobacteria bacterium]|nr:DUF2798 domain-containing protein [Campylobacterota bacterium]